MSKVLLPRRQFIKGAAAALVAAPAIIRPSDAQILQFSGQVAAGGGGDSAWPSADNRPVYNTSTGVLSWTGPLGGGPNNGNPVQQTRSGLTAANDIHTSADGQVIEGMIVGGPSNPMRIYVDHANVTIRQCVIYGDYFGVQIGTTGTGPAHSCIVEDCLIIGALAANGTNGVAGDGSTAGGSIVRRCNITNFENGIYACEDNQIFRDNWIHDLFFDEAISHSDGIQSSGAFTSLKILHNAVYAIDTSCIFMKNIAGTFGGLIVDDNLLVCENVNGSSIIYVWGNAGVSQVTNNRFKEIGNGSYSSVQSNTGTLTWSGNVVHDTGEPIPTYGT